MPSRRARAKHAEVDSTRTRGELRAHLEKLGLQSEDDYRQWCKRHGLGIGIYKSGPQKRKEMDLANLERGKALLSQQRGHTRHPRNTLRQLYDRSLSDEALGAEYLHVIRDHFGRLNADPPTRRAFLDLLLAAEDRGKLFGLEPALPHLGEHPANRFIDGLAQLARYHRIYVRRIKAWTPDSRNPRRQFGHLARHLLASYPEVPAFMDAAWFGESGPGLDRQQSWFLHLGVGGNIRTAPELPVHLTRRMAHTFLQAPHDLPVEPALRWAQVIGQDGGEALARAILETRLAEDFGEEDFWSTVVVFFVRNPMLDPAHVGPIVDYIHNQKYVPEARDLPDGGVLRGDPPQPNFAMKSRSVDKLLRQVDEWHRALNQRIVDPFDDAPQPGGSKRWQRLVSWERSDIGELSHEEVNPSSGESTEWLIRELCSSRTLAAEGRMMHHCVRSYVKSCRNGNTSIWSLSARTDGTRTPVLTIAIDPRRRKITQVRGKYNASIAQAEGRREKKGSFNRADARLMTRSRPVLEHWARQERLQLSR